MKTKKCNADCAFCIGGSEDDEEKKSTVICARNKRFEHIEVDYKTGYGKVCEFYTDME